MFKWISRRCLNLLATASLLAIGAGAAHANIQVTFIPPPIPSGANHRYHYSALVDAVQRVDPGDYFTVNDFVGFVPGSDMIAGALPGWVFSTEPVSTAPPLLPIPLPSDTGIVNLRWTYMGGAPIVGMPIVGTALGIFSAESIYSQTKTGVFLGRATNNVVGGPNFNEKQGNFGPTKVPVVPEPGTMTLLGLGGLPLLRRLVRRGAKA